MDSNHRSVPRQIYSLLPLATREPTHIPMLPASSRWSWRWDLNPQPADYKSAALPIELRQPIVRSTATPFGIPGLKPHCVGNDINYTPFARIVKTFSPIFLHFTSRLIVDHICARPPAPYGGKRSARADPLGTGLRARAVLCDQAAGVTAVMWGLTPSYQ